MSATLKATSLAAGHGDRVLFSGLDLVVAPGDVVGLVGVNGAGKSTLLRMLAGEATAEEGTVTLSPPDATVGYLPQEPERRPGETVRGVPGPAHRGGRRAGRDGRGRRRRWPTGAGADDAYAAALERWLALGGADLDERAGRGGRRARVSAVGLDQPMTGAVRRPGAPAPGWRRCCSPATTSSCSTSPPTTSTSTGWTAWSGSSQGLRAGRRDGQPRPGVPGPHRDPGRRAGPGPAAGQRLRRRLRRRTWPSARWPGGTPARSTRSTPTSSAPSRTRAQTQRTWMAQGVRNARRKSKRQRQDRPQPQVEASEKQAAKARQTERAIERLEVVEEPRKEWELRMEIAAAPRSGTVVAVADAGRWCGAATFALGPVDLQIDWADRVAITGAERRGQVHAARRAARPDPARRGVRGAGLRRAGRRGRPGPRAVPRPAPRWTGVRRRPCPDWPDGRGPHAAGQVRPHAATT